MMNRNKSTTDNKKVYNQWAIMLDASVTNGVCWQITPEMCVQKIEKILNAEKSKNLDKYHIYNGPQYDFGAFEYLSLPEELIQELKGKNRKRN